MLRGTGIGSFFGALPGTGASIASFMSYAVEKKVSKNPEKFGHGAIEGITAPESANNAAAQTAFVPTLSLGIPGDAVMALMLGALIIHGIQPGPLLMTQQPDLFWGLIVSFGIGNIMLMILNLPLIGIWVAILRIPYSVLYPAILVFISLAPYVMVSALGRPVTEFGFYYLFIAAGYFLGNWSVGRLMARHDLHWLVVNGVLLSAAGAVAALVFVAFGLTHPLWIFVPIGVLSYGQGLALPNVTATAVSLAPQHAGVASSTIGFLQQIIGAACVQWMGHFPTDTALPMLVFCAVVCVLGVGMLYVFPRVEAGRRRG
jgi:hypothetical protein